MPFTQEETTTVQATVASVLPSLGLAFVTDGEQDWGVTRSALGDRFDELRPGLRVQLALTQHRTATLVSDCLAISSAPGGTPAR